MTHLYLIRHGQAFANVDLAGPIAGMNGDLGLTPLGRLQAERLRDRLLATREIPAEVFIASTLPRARQTAMILAPAFGLPLIFDDEVQEMRVGELDGKRWSEVEEDIPNFRVEPYRPLAPGGENLGQFTLRVATALDRIAREHAGKTVVIVCHGGVIDSSFSAFLGLNTLALRPFEMSTRNTSITHWEQTAGLDEPPRWRLHRYNDDLHTRDIGAEERIGWVRLPSRDAAPQASEPAVPLPEEENGGPEAGV